MPSYLARLHAKIRREKRGLQVEVAAMQNGVWGESNEVAEIEWSRVESVAERIFGLIAENNLHRRVENAHLRLTQLGQELFQCAFQGSIGGRISGGLSEFLILDLEEDGLGIPWELAHDGIDFLGRRFAVGRKVSGWEGKHSHRPRPVGKCSTLLLSNPSGDLLTAAQEGDNPKEWRDAIYYHYYETGEHNVPRHEGVSTERHKLIYYYDVDQWELFDLLKDPAEIHSEYNNPEYSGIVADMKTKLQGMRDRYEVPPLQPLSAHPPQDGD